jgi:uncharacterized protein YcaQ
METYPFYAWRRSFFPETVRASFSEWGQSNREAIQEVYKKVKKDGPTSSASFGVRKKKSSGWWHWRFEKRALEYLNMTGELMITYRSNFQKFYDLTERVLPPRISTVPLTDEEAAEFVVDITLRSLGLASEQDLRLYLGRFPARRLWNGRKSTIQAHLDENVEEGRIEEVSIEGLDSRYYVHNELRKDLETLRSLDGDEAPVKFLTPFDNIMRDRHFPKELWDFEYQIECYTPAEKRKYGYFTLPILDRNQLVGRVDAKVHRKDRVMEFKSLYLENDFWTTSEGQERLRNGLVSFCDFHDAERFTLGKASPRRARNILKDELKI